MIDKKELRNMLEVIRLEDVETERLRQLQLKADSDLRRTNAIIEITKIDLSLKSSTNSSKKTECYTLMDYLRVQMKTAPDGETKQELQKKIDELLVQANIYKDLQRSE